jgi:hypothetical protein
MHLRPTHLLLAALAAQAVPAHAGTVGAQFGLRLVIEPDCADGQPKVVASEQAAVDLARAYLGADSDMALSADHDPADTGHWLVTAASQQAVLRIDKCTGEVAALSRQ